MEQSPTRNFSTGMAVIQTAIRSFRTGYNLVGSIVQSETRAFRNGFPTIGSLTRYGEDSYGGEYIIPAEPLPLWVKRARPTDSTWSRRSVNNA